MSLASVRDGIGRYFGGAWDQQTRCYRGSPIPMVGVVRRGWAKDDNHADYFYGQPDGARTGCQIIVHIALASEARFTVAGEHGGMKNRRYEVTLLCYIRSRCEHAEDAQDDVDELSESLVEWMRADRTLGGCVFEAGEAVDGGLGSIDFAFGQPETKAQLTKSFMSMTFTALEIIQA